MVISELPPEAEKEYKSVRYGRPTPYPENFERILRGLPIGEQLKHFKVRVYRCHKGRGRSTPADRKSVEEAGMYIEAAYMKDGIVVGFSILRDNGFTERCEYVPTFVGQCHSVDVEAEADGGGFNETSTDIFLEFMEEI